MILYILWSIQWSISHSYSMLNVNSCAQRMMLGWTSKRSPRSVFNEILFLFLSVIVTGFWVKVNSCVLNTHTHTHSQALAALFSLSLSGETALAVDKIILHRKHPCVSTVFTQMRESAINRVSGHELEVKISPRKVNSPMKLLMR